MFHSVTAAIRKCRKWLIMLAGVVVFVVTYALILPAITIDNETAKEEPGLEIVLQESEIADESEAAPDEGEADMPAVVLEQTSGDVSVKVKAEAGVFPSDTVLVLSEVSGRKVLDPIEDALADPVKEVQAVAVSFVDADGEPVEPLDSFTLTVGSAVAEADASHVLVAVDKDGEASVFAKAAEMVVAPSDAPVLALVETGTLTTTYLSASGAEYFVTVTFNEKAKIPEGSELRLTEIHDGNPVYNEARQILLDADILPDWSDDGEGEDSPEVNTVNASSVVLPMNADESDDALNVELDVLDISIVGPDGSEIEPAAPVQVEIVMKSLPEDISHADFYSSVTVTHLCETENGLVPEIVAGNSAGQPGEVAVQNDEAVMTFETASFSTYTITWGRSNGNRATVHYGYIENGRFVEFSESQFANGTPNILRSNQYNFLIYDVTGYEYDHAYLGSDSASNQLQPYLYSSGTTNYTYYKATSNSTATGSPETGNLSNGNHIYMVYKPVTDPVPSGVAKIYETSETPHEPEILKESVNNHDGTRTLSLSITGYEAPLEFERLVDVIVIFDVSGSMNTTIEGSSSSRLESGKDALQFLANQLLGPDRVNREGEKLNRMALISFSNSAQIVQDFTDDPAVYNASVEGLDADGGTNWELPLHIANRMSVDPDRQTVVIFVSDGNPTWRMTRFNVSDSQLRNSSDMHSSNSYGYYRYYNVFGQGNSDNAGRNYQAALAEAQAIVGQGKEFYTIAIGPDVDKMETLTVDAGVDEDNAFVVQTETELTNAINKIEQSINGAYGWGDIGMNDGITGLTNLLAKTPITGLDESSFTYTRIKDGVEEPWDPEAAGAHLAEYNAETGVVEWHMGANFQLEHGVTYKVSFKVWPNQQATDMVTDLNNGTLDYDTLDDEIKAQFVESGGVYTVKTNTDDAHVTYCPSLSVNGNVTITGDPEILYFDPVEPLVVQTMPMVVEKIFRDSFGDETGDGVGADRPNEVHLTLERRLVGSDGPWETCTVTYQNPQQVTVTSDDIWLSEGNHWKAEFWVSPGLWDAEGVHRNIGYEYRLTEEETEYHYELISEELNPYLQGFHEPTDGMDPALAGEEVYVVKHYNGDTDGSESLTAANTVKGGINLFKHVTGEGSGADLDAEFTIRGWILDPDGNPYLFDQANDERTDKSQKANETATPLFYEHQNDPLPYHFYDSTGRRVIYKGHFDSTGQIEFKIKDGEQIRFPIIPTGCTYLFWEVDDEGMPTGFVLENVTGVAQENLPNPSTGVYEFMDSPDLSKYPVVNADNEIGGTIYGNTLFKLEFFNRYVQPNHIAVTKKLTNVSGSKQIYPEDTFTVSGYVRNRYGRAFTFDPILDDREDKSQPLPESEYDTHTWDEHQDDPIAYNIIDKDGNYVVYKGHFPTTDSITVELRSGDTLEFLNVPAASSYQFYENTSAMDDPDSLYEYVSSSGQALLVDGGTATQPTTFPNTDGYTVVAGTVHENEDHSILFVNRMKYDIVELRIEKVDASNPERRLNGATFMLYADEDQTIPATDYTGVPIGPIVTGGYADAEQTQPLGIGYVGNLIPGTYYLVETGAPPGYNAVQDVIIVTVTSDGVTVMHPENAAGTTVYTQDEIVTIVVTNSTGKELPSTGGYGTFLYTSGGLLLMAAAMIYLIRVRRRERRLE
ncbi:MAG: VWA domain-containing protein [Clostridia bacterium]|nr:VWA domain-containing protein [Clostridia bacterium]